MFTKRTQNPSRTCLTSCLEFGPPSSSAKLQVHGLWWAARRGRRMGGLVHGLTCVTEMSDLESSVLLILSSPLLSCPPGDLFTVENGLRIKRELECGLNNNQIFLSALSNAPSAWKSEYLPRIYALLLWSMDKCGFDVIGHSSDVTRVFQRCLVCSMRFCIEGESDGQGTPNAAKESYKNCSRALLIFLQTLLPAAPDVSRLLIRKCSSALALVLFTVSDPVSSYFLSDISEESGSVFESLISGLGPNGVADRADRYDPFSKYVAMASESTMVELVGIIGDMLRLPDWYDSHTCRLIVERLFCALNYHNTDLAQPGLCCMVLVMMDHFHHRCRTFGLRCYRKILAECSFSIAKRHNYPELFYQKLYALMYSRDADVLAELLPCMTELLRLIEPRPVTEEALTADTKWSIVMKLVLDNIALLSDPDLKVIYLRHAPAFLTGMSTAVVLYSSRIISVVQQLLEHDHGPSQEVRIAALDLLLQYMSISGGLGMPHVGELLRVLLHLIVDLDGALQASDLTESVHGQMEHRITRLLDTIDGLHAQWRPSLASVLHKDGFTARGRYHTFLYNSINVEYR